MKATRSHARIRRHRRVRKKIRGSSGRPRLAVVYRSNRYIYAQVIDDDRGHTVAAAPRWSRACAAGPSLWRPLRWWVNSWRSGAGGPEWSRWCSTGGDISLQEESRPWRTPLGLTG